MNYAPKKQGGIALLVSLVLLLTLTIIAVTASNTASLQERMALNSQQNNTAFQAAESGLDFVSTSIEAAAKGNANMDTLASTLTNNYNSATKTTNSLISVTGRLETGNSLGGNIATYRYEYRSCGSATSVADTPVTTCPANNADLDPHVTAKHAQGYRARIGVIN
ncbi:type IV pilus assembly protein PilX [Atopomonas hussainii]|uniref:Type IV pilus assembly protein PilX n=1 Tax=Atopomonas hussainii TaxID=1429083 RepID=A0A1H7J2G4_9GAMM|nr:pilus assembly PilX N-terminal domain-containing protein [Atopomonas hussainii]SEK68160.1 type IV pilus assembly protein PilX [Atopomonas hussainii]